MKTMHTPGPWTLGPGRTIATESGEFFISYGSERGTGAPLFRGGFDVLDRNARLVAAAPELLDALRLAVAVMRAHDIDEAMGGEFDVFTDAVAKAEGSE